MTPDEDWSDMGRKLRGVLADGLEVGGTIEETDTLTHVGSSSLEIVIEVSDLERDEQAAAYRVLCDLLETRLRQGCTQVVGCLIFAGEADPDSLATGLVGMLRPSGAFTPVVPFSRSQAEVLAESDVAFDAVIDDVTALIGVAADRKPITADTAATLLDELDELIARRT